MTAPRFAQIGERRVPTREKAPSTMCDHSENHETSCTATTSHSRTSTESDLQKIRAEMCGWHEVRARGGRGGGKRDVRETDILGRSQVDG